MEAWVRIIFGEGDQLSPWQMSARAMAVFVIALVLIRLSGRRSFGQHGPFDACTTVLFGAVLSRAVVGASPFWATIAAATTLVVMHRCIGLACVRWRRLDALVSGHHVELIRSGHIDEEAMRQALVARGDLEHAVRDTLGVDDLAVVERAVLERNGDITVIGR